MKSLDDKTGSRYHPLQTKLAWVLEVFPNLPAALVVLALVPVEALLLLAHPGHVYRNDPFMVVFVPVALFWVWFSVGWVLWLVVITASNRINRWPKLLRAGVIVFIGSGAVAAIGTYVVSWMLYIHSGQFLDYEGIHFILNKPQMLASYLIDGQPTDLLKAVATTTTTVIAAVFILRWLERSRWEIAEPARVRSRRRIAWLVCTLALASGLLHFTRDSSFLRMIQRFEGLTRRLNPLVALTTSVATAAIEEGIDEHIDPENLQPIGPNDWQPPQLSNPPSIVFVVIESLRPEMIHELLDGQFVMPNLSALAKNSLRLSCVHSHSTHTDYADPCIWSSLYPLRTRRHHYYQLSDPWPKTRLFDPLHAAGYATAYFSSQNETWGNMDQFLLSPTLDVFYHYPNGRDASQSLPAEGQHREPVGSSMYTGKIEDRYTTDVALPWITQQTKLGKPFFLGLSYQNSHFPYLLPPDVARPFQPCELDSSISFFGYPAEKTRTVRNAYRNALHETGRNLGRLVKTLRDVGRLENTILVVLGDHGEFFREHDRVTHACEPFEPGIRVGCIINAPNRVVPGVDDYPVELVDLVPTTFGLMGWPSHPNFQGIDVLSAKRPLREVRLTFAHVENLSTRWDVVVLGGRWKFMHDRSEGDELLFDVVTNPGESTNLLSTKPELSQSLREALRTWRRQQLAYYHYPNYYRNYYPPRPPRMDRRFDLSTGEAIVSGP